MKESDLVALWYGYALDARNIADVGSRYGSFTIAANRVATNADIHAFEPNPFLHESCRKSLVSTSNRIHFHGCALGASDGTAPLHLAPSATMVDGLLPPDAPTVQTQVTTLDRALPDPVDLLKIDVEGFELHVLRGATRHLATCPTIFLETHPVFLKNLGQSEDECLRLLTDRGYHLVRLWRTGNRAQATHYLCTK